MSVETPIPRDVSSRLPRDVRRSLAPETDAVQVKSAGQGAAKAPDPFADLRMPTYTQEEWEAFVKGKPPPGSQPQGGGQYASTGDTGAVVGGGSATGTAADLIKKAKAFVGTPYVWGGTSPNGFDCSGFTQYVYRAFGINLPRVSYQQAAFGKRVSIGQARPGDLVAWDNSSRNNGADHIAIYLGDGLVIHAPKPGDRVKISKVWGNPWAVQMNL